MFQDHFDFIWRQVRRLGVREDRADDATQQVFIVAAQKLDQIAPGCERAFLYGTAMRVASDIRRSAPVRREVYDEAALDVPAISPPVEDAIDQARARQLLDQILTAMPEECRVVFTLFELEEMTTTEIATFLGIPQGTVASRLRRGREHYEAAVARIRARNSAQLLRGPAGSDAGQLHPKVRGGL